MSFEFWIIAVVVGAGLSVLLGYALARRGAPSKAELESLQRQLEDAKSEAERVQSSVNEHFEQSAVLFGKLAKDYREFLEHFSTSAQVLGLSEQRARELIEQGFQPLLTHHGEDAIEAEEAPAAAAAVADAAPSEDVPEEREAAERPAAEEEATDESLASAEEAAQVDVEVPTLEDITELGPERDQESASAATGAPAKVAEVVLELGETEQDSKQTTGQKASS